MDLEELRGLEGTAEVLVAGGAGFIGSHLVKNLLCSEKIDRVLVIDNFVSGSLENLREFENDTRLEVLRKDITDPEVIATAGKNFDLVFHLAAVANPLDYEKQPNETLRVNSEGSRNLIDIAGRSGAKYVFFSSSEIYGDHNNIPPAPLSESSRSMIFLNKKRSPYVVGKCFGEEMTINMCRREGIDHLIIRPFNIYGPNMDLMTNYGRVIPNFCIWGIRGRPMRIHGDGTQVRSFCHIDDLISALFLLIEKGVDGRSVNIGYPNPISILDLARSVSRILGIEENFIFVDKYEFEPYIRIPDISLINGLTGWKPRIDLGAGLIRTVEWFRTAGLEKYLWEKSKGTSMDEISI